MAEGSWQSEVVRLAEMVLLGPTFVDTTMARLRGMPQTAEAQWGDREARVLQLLKDPRAFGKAWMVNAKIEWAVICVVLYVTTFCFVGEYALFSAALFFGLRTPNVMSAILGLMAASIYAVLYTARPTFDPADSPSNSQMVRGLDRRNHAIIACFPAAAAVYIVGQQVTWASRTVALVLYAVVVYGTVLLTSFVILAARRLPVSEVGDIVWHRLASHWFPQSDPSKATTMDLLAAALSDEMETFEDAEKPDTRSRFQRWNNQCLEVWGIVCQVFDAWRDTYDRMDDFKYHNARRVRLVWEIVLVLLTSGFLVVEIPIVVGARYLHRLPHDMTPAMVIGSALMGYWFAHEYVRLWFKSVAREVPLFRTEPTDESNGLLSLLTLWQKYLTLYSLNLRFAGIGFQMFMAAGALALLGFHIFGVLVALNIVAPVLLCLYIGSMFASFPSFDGHITSEYWIEVIALRCDPTVRSVEVPVALEELARLRRSGATSIQLYQRTWTLALGLLLAKWRRPRTKVE